MDLRSLIERGPIVLWSPGGKIPWHDPGFSARMLREHLSQEHDRASRRFETIDSHVTWLHEAICHDHPARILDLGCGPGLYTSRLARRGHACVGIDFSPASIAYARAEAARDSLACEYRLQDLREADPGTGFDVVLFVFGELNTFAPDDARALLANARRCLKPRGTLVLEVHSESIVRAMGAAEPSWFTAEQSVFSDEPHLCLKECFWHPEPRATTERYFVVALVSGRVSEYESTTQAYSDDEYIALLRDAGFGSVTRQPSLSGGQGSPTEGLFVLTAVAERVP